MRKLLAMTLVAGLLVFAGCGKPKTAPPTGGTTTTPASKPPAPPPVTTPATKPVDPPPPAAGEIKVKDAAVEVEKEKDAKVKIAVERKDYKGEIAVKFESKAKGVTVDPAEAKIEEGKDDVEVTVKAAKDAENGDIIVTATPKDEKIKPATATIKVTVK